MKVSSRIDCFWGDINLLMKSYQLSIPSLFTRPFKKMAASRMKRPII